MFCSVNPSEDPEKTRKSISNIFPYSTTKNEIIQFLQNQMIQSLERIYEAVHSKQSQKTYRRNLQKNLKNDSTYFYLNKQSHL